MNTSAREVRLMYWIGALTLSAFLAACSSASGAAGGKGPLKVSSSATKGSVPRTTAPSTSTTTAPTTTTTAPTTTTTAPFDVSSELPSGSYDDALRANPNYVVNVVPSGGSVNGSVVDVAMDGNTRLLFRFAGTAHRNGTLDVTTSSGVSISANFGPKELTIPNCSAYLPWFRDFPSLFRGAGCTFRFFSDQIAHPYVRGLFPPVSASVISALNTAGIVVTPAPATAHPSVSADSAAADAVWDAPWVDTAKGVSLVELANVGGPSTSTTLAWLVSLQEPPPIYQAGGPAVSSTTSTSTGRPASNFFVVLVNASTGKFIRATSGFDPSLSGGSG